MIRSRFKIQEIISRLFQKLENISSSSYWEFGIGFKLERDQKE